MTDAWRKAGVFAAGILLGGALALWAYKMWTAPQDVAADAAVLAPTSIEAEPAAAASEAAAPPAPVMAAAVPAGCPADPLLARAGDADGQFSLQAALATNSGSDPSAFLKVAGDMAGQGRARDAEVAYIVACRVAAQASGSPSTPVADVQTQLAQHYAALANLPARAGQRPQLVERATSLLQEGVRTYSAALGANASKTQLASRRLDALNQPNETIISGPGAGLDATTLGAAAASAEAAAGVNPGASADCANARSASEKVVCTDEDIAELDRDLDRLRAQARAVTRDPGGFAQRQEQAWAKRESQCKGDKACLRSWYAQRKRELFSEF
ncbi:MAG: hypothetical protein EOP80_17030 [Variovorax sp.]|nr:MAG: hypothetical protein EOP80_17030 [Variovorax sp.]